MRNWMPAVVLVGACGGCAVSDLAASASVVVSGMLERGVGAVRIAGGADEVSREE